MNFKKWTLGLLLVSGLMATSCKFETPKEKVTQITADGNLATEKGQKIQIPGLGDPNKTVIFIVRHGEKAADDQNAVLNQAGKTRAQHLTDMLKSVKIDRVCAIDDKGALETIEIVRNATNAPYSTFTAGVIEPFLDDLVNTHHGKNTVIVAGKNSVPVLLNKLTGEAKFKDLAADKFDDLYIVASNKLGQSEILEFKY